MSFILRSTSRRAGGGHDIVRQHAIVSSEPLIGRGADCDIRLADLSVSLNHARLCAPRPGFIEITAIGRLGFEAGGRFVTKADLSLADKPEVVIGSHSLVFAVGAALGDIIVSVTRRENAPDGSKQDGERAVFAPRGGILGNRRIAWVSALGILLACLAAPIALFFAWHGHQTARLDKQWLAGPLSTSHAFLQNRCVACHTDAFVAVRDDACLSCHSASMGRTRFQRLLADDRREGSPFAPRLVFAHAPHDRLSAATPPPAGMAARIKAFFQHTFNHTDDRCASCHLEHIALHPPTAPLAPPGKPVLINTNTCVDCHAGMKRTLVTSLFDVPDWRRHPDFRPVVAVAGLPDLPRYARTPITWRRPDPTGLTFSHRVHLLPTGFAARMAVELGAARGYGAPLTCADCHSPSPDGRSFLPVQMTRDCSACHSLAFARSAGVLQYLPHGAARNDLPHGSARKIVERLMAFYGSTPATPPGDDAAKRRIPGIAQAILQWWRRRLMPPSPSARSVAAIRSTFAPGGVCSTCHTVVRPSDPTSLAYRVSPVHMTQRYLPNGGFDHGLPAHHADIEGRPTCGACHSAKESDRSGDVLIPGIEKCAACHGKSPLQTASAASSDCAECHSYHSPGAATHRNAGHYWDDRASTKAIVSAAIRSSHEPNSLRGY